MCILNTQSQVQNSSGQRREPTTLVYHFQLLNQTQESQVLGSQGGTGTHCLSALWQRGTTSEVCAIACSITKLQRIWNFNKVAQRQNRFEHLVGSSGFRLGNIQFWRQKYFERESGIRILKHKKFLCLEFGDSKCELREGTAVVNSVEVLHKPKRQTSPT